MSVYLEIGALFEEHWTGIPSVVAAIAARAVLDDAIDWRFNFESLEIPRETVREFLARRSGGPDALARLRELAWRSTTIPRASAKKSVGIYPNIKPMQNFFGREATIVYDLSPLLTPQYHHGDNISHFANRIQMDIDRSDHIFCISEATMRDVHLYLGKPREHMSLIRMGIDCRPHDLSLARVFPEGARVEDYVAIIGTLEPRKNGGIVLEYLARNPAFADRFRIVFIGRDGWLQERERLMGMINRAGVSSDRVVFTGFVTESEKTALILNSRFCVYASFFEGYGLPVLEASALGKLTVCSNTSSMPEVAPSDCVFFDPLDIDDFGEALELAVSRSGMLTRAPASLAELVERSNRLGWDDCYNVVADWARSQ